MTQIKLFMDHTPYMDKFEEKVNSFLKENEGKIVVKDIKYTSDSVNPHNSVWKNWTAMIVYETIE